MALGLNGFLLLDKTEGVSSNQALYPIKKLLPKGTKIGHSGTLDPEASGLLVIAIGRATRFLSYIKKNNKTYSARIKFGIKTDSADIWGNIIEERAAHNLTLDKIKRHTAKFIGEISQIPPMYSALKKDGMPLYKLARKGIVVERAPRKQFIYSIDVLSFEYPYCDIEVSCDAGTYIRTLIEDIASSMGEIACMSYLRRTATDGFSVDESLSIDKITSLEAVSSNLLKLDCVFSSKPHLEVDYDLLKDLRNGKKIDILSSLSEEKSAELLADDFFIIGHKAVMIALVEVDRASGRISKILWKEDELGV